MAFQKGDREISTMAHALDRYFGNSLNSGKDMIRLKDEVEQVSNDVIVQNIRHGKLSQRALLSSLYEVPVAGWLL